MEHGESSWKILQKGIGHLEIIFSFEDFSKKHKSYSVQDFLYRGKVEGKKFRTETGNKAAVLCPFSCQCHRYAPVSRTDVLGKLGLLSPRDSQLVCVFRYRLCLEIKLLESNSKAT